MCQQRFYRTEVAIPLDISGCTVLVNIVGMNELANIHSTQIIIHLSSELSRYRLDGLAQHFAAKLVSLGCFMLIYDGECSTH